MMFTRAAARLQQQLNDFATAHQDVAVPHDLLADLLREEVDPHALESARALRGGNRLQAVQVPQLPPLPRSKQKRHRSEKPGIGDGAYVGLRGGRDEASADAAAVKLHPPLTLVFSTSGQIGEANVQCC